MDIVTIGAVVGSVIGLIGGIIGTACSLGSARSVVEGRVLIKASIMCCVLIGSFIGVFLILGPQKGAFLWIPYGVLLPLGVVYTNEKIRRIRESSG